MPFYYGDLEFNNRVDAVAYAKRWKRMEQDDAEAAVETDTEQVAAEPQPEVVAGEAVIVYNPKTGAKQRTPLQPDHSIARTKWLARVLTERDGK